MSSVTVYHEITDNSVPQTLNLNMVDADAQLPIGGPAAPPPGKVMREQAPEPGHRATSGIADPQSSCTIVQASTGSRCARTRSWTAHTI